MKNDIAIYSRVVMSVYTLLWLFGIGFGFVTFDSDDGVERATREQYLTILNKKVCIYLVSLNPLTVSSAMCIVRKFTYSGEKICGGNSVLISGIWASYASVADLTMRFNEEVSGSTLTLRN